jgi:hypothetical protein
MAEELHNLCPSRNIARIIKQMSRRKTEPIASWEIRNAWGTWRNKTT